MRLARLLKLLAPLAEKHPQALVLIPSKLGYEVAEQGHFVNPAIAAQTRQIMYIKYDEITDTVYMSSGV